MDKFNKIIVIGSPGSGKTHFSNILGNLINIPVYHLDDLYWEEDWKEKNEDEWIKIQKGVLGLDNFIIDGNYLSSLEIRIHKSQLIIFIDRGVIRCLFGFLKRSFRSKTGIEVSLPEKIKNQKNYRVTENGVISFAIYIIKFHLFNKKKLRKLLEKYNNRKKIIVLKSRREIKNFLKEYSNGK